MTHEWKLGTWGTRHWMKINFRENQRCNQECTIH